MTNIFLLFIIILCLASTSYSFLGQEQQSLCFLAKLCLLFGHLKQINPFYVRSCFLTEPCSSVRLEFFMRVSHLFCPSFFLCQVHDNCMLGEWVVQCRFGSQVIRGDAIRTGTSDLLFTRYTLSCMQVSSPHSIRIHGLEALFGSPWDLISKYALYTVLQLRVSLSLFNLLSWLNSVKVLKCGKSL